MTATIPSIRVYNKKSPRKTSPGKAGRIAVIGAFKTTTVTTPTIYDNIDDAQAALGTDETFNGCLVLPQLFKGAESILAVNIATESGGTWTKTITPLNLTEALASIKNEKFDMIFIADVLTDAFMPILTTFTDTRYLNKIPVGYSGCVNEANIDAYYAIAALQSDACYGIITQAFYVNGESLSLLESSAYYAAVIASMDVGRSLTTKQIPGVTGLNPELTFETGDQGKLLNGIGYTVLRCRDRENNIYEVVNSEQFNGYDLYINRVRDYVIREMALYDFLGNRNRTVTYSEIQQEVDRVKKKCIKSLDLLADIEYYLEKKSSKCVEIHITKLLFDDIITNIDVYITIEVQ